MDKLQILEINITPLRNQNGLVGFASCVLNNQFYCGNIAIYTSPSSSKGFRLVFPNKKLPSGQVVACFHPINKEAEQQVTSAIINKYWELMENFHHVEVI